MTTHVFLGPSLPVEEARAILGDATFLPPAQAGDVSKLTERGATVIAIVDGFFEQFPAVWHKEVLHALSRGIHVFGASSMGALRAAELHAFGMVGVGRIFEAYRDGTLTDDDEVTVAHGPASWGFRPLSDAMVNLRHGLAQAREQAIISTRTHDALVRALKTVHYPRRSWALLPELAARHELPAEEVNPLIRFVRTTAPNLKRLDALELLCRLEAFTREPPAPFEPRFEFEATAFWHELSSSMRSVPVAGGAGVPLEAIQHHVAVVEPDSASVMEGALLLYFAVAEAERLKLAPDAASVATTAERFRRRHGLHSAASTHAWLADNDLDPAGFSRLMELLATLERMLEHHASKVGAFLPAELLRRGHLGATTRAVLQKAEALSSLGLHFPSPEDVGTTVPDLLRWYEATFRRLDAPIHHHSRSRGVLDSARFVREIVAEYVSRRAAGKPGEAADA
jgi:hypothetical protein